MPGLYLLGLPFLRRRRSNLLAGLGFDAAELCQHLVEYLEEVGRSTPPDVTAEGRVSCAPMSARRVRNTMSSTGQLAPAASSSPACSSTL